MRAGMYFIGAFAALVASPVAASRVAFSSSSSESCTDTLKALFDGIPWADFVSLKDLKKAKKVMFFEGKSDFTFGNFSVLHPQPETFKDFRDFERKRMEKLLRLDLKTEENKIRGICDASMWALKALSHSPLLLKEMQAASPGSNCAGLSLTAVSKAAERALEELCFDSCMATTTDVVKDIPCPTEVKEGGFVTEEAWNKILDANEQCLALPFDSLEYATFFPFSKKCGKFSRPNLLWMIQDKAPNSIAMKDNVPVCQLPKDKSGTKFSSNIIQAGECPAGSKCKCPKTRMWTRKTAGQMRMKFGVHLAGQELTSSGGAGTAAVPSLVKQYSKGWVMSTVMGGMLINGLAVGAAVVASFEAPVFLIPSSVILTVKNAMEFAKFHCESTLGCWPQEPSGNGLGASKCRLPAKAQKGGSPFWFLPPPMMRLKRHKGSCILDVCKLDDMLHQRVGASSSKPDLYNCQPLSHEDMSPDQFSEYMARLVKSGLGEEYDLTALGAPTEQEIDVEDEVEDDDEDAEEEEEEEDEEELDKEGDDEEEDDELIEDDGLKEALEEH